MRRLKLYEIIILYFAYLLDKAGSVFKRKTKTDTKENDNKEE